MSYDVRPVEQLLLTLRCFFFQSFSSSVKVKEANARGEKLLCRTRGKMTRIAYKSLREEACLLAMQYERRYN